MTRDTLNAQGTVHLATDTEKIAMLTAQCTQFRNDFIEYRDKLEVATRTINRLKQLALFFYTEKQINEAIDGK